jgi:hypothetical protein
MTQIYKLFVVKDEPYLTIDEDVIIGDKAIITVGELYPTLVECQNKEQIDLFQKPKTSMTKRHKIVKEPKDLNLSLELINEIISKEVGVLVEYEDGEIKIIE